MRKFFGAAAFSFVFLFFGLLTIKDYGISWDEPEHFFRGQAYLWYFLTGDKTYKALPPYNLNEARNNKDYHERSYYQHDSLNANTWLISDKGHPPLNDILASFTNFIFYQKLGLLGDIESHHLFNVLISSVLIGAVFLFAAETFGLWAGVFSSLFLAAYPLFWAESHFNIKDPAQSSLFFLSLYFLWRGVNTLKLRFILLSSLFAGFALSVKFNILFMPFVIAPWLIHVLLASKQTRAFIFSKNTIAALIVFPVIMFGILVSSWPFLWQDILGNTLSIFTYYKELGTEESFTLNPVASWNFYAISWILYTTPPFLLVLFPIGLLVALKSWSKNSSVSILWLSLFSITLLRVSFPNTTIYGGVRQIMEYIPAMALLSGVGANFVLSKLKNFQFLFILVAFSLLPLSIIKLYPNENVYFNFLIGGLPGAKEKNITSWGNSYGNAYWQAINWLNNNAEKNSRLALIQGTSLNIATATLRPDIDFSNSYWSGIYREGEYLLELTYQGKRLYPFVWNYVDNLLDPVYQVKVDGVALAKIWKNDVAHTKPEFRRTEVIYSGKIKADAWGGTILLTMDKVVNPTRLVISYDKGKCSSLKALVAVSTDGENWKYEDDLLPTEQVALREKKETLPENFAREVFFVVAPKTRFIKLEPNRSNLCLLAADPTFQLYILED